MEPKIPKAPPHSTISQGDFTDQLTALLHLSGDAVLILDRDHRVTAINAPAEALLHQSGSELIGQTIETLFAPREWELVQAAVQTGGEASAVIELGGGASQTCEVRGVATSAGLVLMLRPQVHFATDLAKGALAEELLRQSPDAILLTDLNLRIQAWLGNAEQLFGYKAEEMIGKTTNSLLPATASEENLAEFQRQVRENGAFHGDVPAIRKDGRQILVELTARVICDDQGQPLGLLGINRDITQRKQAEIELRRSESQYRKLLEHLPAGVLLHAPTTELLFCNAAAERFLGISRETVIGARVNDPSWSFYREDGTRLSVDEIPLQQVIRTKQPLTDFLTRIEKPDGSAPRWIVINAYPEIDAAGALRHVVISFLDVTAQRKMVEELRQSYEMLTLAQRIAHIGHWEHDLLTNRAEWSEEMFRIFGMDEEEFSNRPESFLSRVHPEDRDRLTESFANALNGHYEGYTEFRLLLPDGSEKYVRSHAIASKSDNEKPTHLVGTIQDATEIHQALDALRASETRYRTIVQDQTEFVVRWLPGGIRTFVNDAYCRFARQSREEILGTSFFSRIPIEIRDEFHAGLAELTPESPIRQGERRWEAAPGQVYWTHWTDRAIFDKSGNLIEYQSVGRDITRQKLEEQSRRQLELRVQHAQKLESLGILAGGIAHDFNNLLTGILGNASLAMMDVIPGSPPEQCLHQIETICQRAAELCKQMLAYSGKGQFVVEPVDLSELVREMGDLLKVSIAKNVLIDYRLGSRLPKILADASQIRQVVMNLITNASEAIGETSGSVTISTQVVWADRQTLSSTYIDQDLPPGNYVVLQVTDTGVGMDKATQAKLFDPFFTTKFTGRGLGLAAVLGIVRGHHGAIRVDSEQGRGSTFTLFLPAAAEDSPAPAGTEDRVDYHGSGVVLVIDDEEYIRNISARMLTAAGFNVHVASDGKEGLELFRKLHPNVTLVLLDMTMPVMGGTETYREIRKIDPNARVILSSGFTEQEAVRRFSEQGIRGFLQKPYRRRELMTAIQNALEM